MAGIILPGVISRLARMERGVKCLRTSFEIWGIVGFLLLAGILRVAFLDYSSLWLDEIISVKFAQVPLQDLPRVLGKSDSHPPLYYVLLHLWLYIEHTDFWIRLLSVLFGMGVCIISYFIGRELGGKTFGFWVALLVSVHFWQVWASRETRNFVVVSFFISLSIWFFLRILLGSRGIKEWAFYIVSSILSIYTFYYALLVIIVQNICFAIYALKRQIKPWRWIGSQLTLAGLFGIWVPIFLKQKARVSADIAYATSGFSFVEWSKKTGEVIARLDPSPLGRIFFRFEWNPLIFWIIFLGFLGLSTLYWWRKRHRVGATVIPLLAVGPIFIGGVLHFTSNLYFHYRYFTLLVPLFCVIVVAAIMSLGYRKVVLGILLLLVTINVYRSSRLWKVINEQWREVTAYIEKNANQGDGVVFFAAFTKDCFDYYAQKSIPSLAIPWDLKAPDIVGRVSRLRTVLTPDDLPLIEQEISSFKRVWLVLSHTQKGRLKRGEELLLNWFKHKQNTFRYLQEVEFKGIKLYLYEHA